MLPRRARPIPSYPPRLRSVASLSMLLSLSLLLSLREGRAGRGSWDRSIDRSETGTMATDHITIPTYQHSGTPLCPPGACSVK